MDMPNGCWIMASRADGLFPLTVKSNDIEPTETESKERWMLSRIVLKSPRNVEMLHDCAAHNDDQPTG